MRSDEKFLKMLQELESYMLDNVLLNKVDIMERCIRRITEVYDGDGENLRNDQNKQDAILLNLERACQAAIDMAMRAVKLKKLGLPKESREAFDLLFQAGIIDEKLRIRMHGLVGFRNTAIHNYKKIDLVIVEKIITSNLSDFLSLSQTLITKLAVS